MLENTNSGTIYHLQGTIYRLIRSTLRRLFVYSFSVETLSARSKVKSQRTKVEAICHRYQLSPLAIANSCVCRFPLHPLVIIPTFLIPLYFIQVGGGTTGSFLHIYTNLQEEQAET